MGAVPSILAGILAAAAPLTAVHAQNFKEDIVVAPMLVLSIITLLRLSALPTSARAVLFGIFAGLALSAKYIGAIVILLPALLLMFSPKPLTKGCHGNYRSMLDMTQSVSVVAPNEITYLFLPLAHSFALLLQLGSFDIGASIAYWERDPLKIIPNLSEVRPHYFPSVPRIFEKIYMAATSAADKEGGVKKRIFWWRSRSASGCERWAPPVRPGACSASSTASPTAGAAKIRGLVSARVRQSAAAQPPSTPTSAGSSTPSASWCSRATE